MPASDEHNTFSQEDIQTFALVWPSFMRLVVNIPNHYIIQKQNLQNDSLSLVLVQMAEPYMISKNLKIESCC